MRLALSVPIGEYDPLRDSRHKTARAARDVADWLAWLELGGIRPRTLEDYEWIVARLLRMFPLIELAEFTDGDLAHCFRTFPAGSRRTKVAAVASLFKWAIRTGRISRNPMDLLPTIRETPSKPLEIFSEAEVSLLSGLPSPDGTLMRILFETGIRKGEARNLQIRHVLLDQSELHVIQGKGGRDRIVPILLDLRQQIAEFLILEGADPEDYFWHTTRANQYGHRVSRSTPIADGTFHAWWVSRVLMAGVRYHRPHTTRHTFATTWRRRGLGLEEIQALLGHASIRTTADAYLHTDLSLVAVHMAELVEVHE